MSGHCMHAQGSHHQSCLDTVSADHSWLEATHAVCHFQLDKPLQLWLATSLWTAAVAQCCAEPTAHQHPSKPAMSTLI